ncbi:DUF3575 domain-containing protein [Psychroserpens sp.]|uniref:DUF3575 domain-containing protein n=1 Tax=Psychroserpens sp. TaxID=2020870 RepID=UPI001B2A3C33|nr:DUF3575 domain-containing protein [Psychroserpens sp.]MBO6605593.1 DUF3575 domain-containing protein [Psychroserpens sp.]MBO6630052.1 DUF3575 domain-containing protein [Psychroserpens sp.]MBO6653598.1 DUF3575 domain-containing protein [Psychroserpens sp.]MBO6681919.1 DUF3575 domain-containing protein [Psychroserpens sp.]MBO6748967.1 DUF3575 domain-containing protein [Psychroserpens sp.]
MKKFILSICFLAITIQAMAQSDTNSDSSPERSNELKINALFMVIGAFDITYERILNDESAVGLEVFLPFDDDLRDDIKYYISPYYRMYFGKKRAAGFFLEGFGMLNRTVVSETFLDGLIFIDPVDVVEETNFALGIGVGGKWITNNNFVGELSVGVGRNILSSDYDNDFVGKVGITIGYRF